MTYATLSDMTTRFGEVELAQLTDRAEGLVVQQDVLDRALDDATAEVDGYLATRYRLPLAVVPQLLVRLVCDIARYRLYDERTTEAVRQRYEDSVRMLKSISTGAVLLAGAELTGADAPQPTGDSRVTTRTPARMFDPDGLALY